MSNDAVEDLSSRCHVTWRADCRFRCVSMYLLSIFVFADLNKRRTLTFPAPVAPPGLFSSAGPAASRRCDNLASQSGRWWLLLRLTDWLAVCLCVCIFRLLETSSMRHCSLGPITVVWMMSCRHELFGLGMQTQILAEEVVEDEDNDDADAACCQDRTGVLSVRL